MASAFSLLFFTLFSDSGPINSLLMQIGFISEPYKFLFTRRKRKRTYCFNELPYVVW